MNIVQDLSEEQRNILLRIYEAGSVDQVELLREGNTSSSDQVEYISKRAEVIAELEKANLIRRQVYHWVLSSTAHYACHEYLKLMKGTD